jgi:adenylate cyclase
VLDDGIRKAIAVLQRSVPFEDMLLVFRQEDDLRGASLNYKIIQKRRAHARLAHAGRHGRGRVHPHGRHRDDPRALARAARPLRHPDLPRRGADHGVRDERVLGRVVVTSARGEFNTYDRDLLERFADALRQRVVDFNREWKHLSLCFPPDTVRRLLHEEGYVERYLVPREQDVAILYCDISGFTRISEQVLGEPALIGALVNTWSAARGGHRLGDRRRLRQDGGRLHHRAVGPALQRAVAGRGLQARGRRRERIRDYTRTLNDGVELPALAGMELPIGVATGLNYCRLFVGLFGPDEDYTGFSSGMNNTARLQGVATRDQILCMDAVRGRAG